MAIVLLIIILAILILAVIFAIQNVAAVPIAILFWEVQGSLALVLLLALVIGALIAVLFALPTFYKNRREMGRMKKQIASLEEELEEKSTRLEMVEEQIREMEQPEEPLEPVEEPPSEADEQVEELVEEAPVGEVEPGAGLESDKSEAEFKPEDSEEAPASEDAAQDSE